MFLALIGWLPLAVAPAPAQEGAPASGVDILRFALAEIAEARRTDDVETARWHVEEIGKVLAEDERIASEEELALLGQLEAQAGSPSLPGPLHTIRERILRSSERTRPEDHPDLLAARTNLALTMWEMGGPDGC